MPEQHRPTRRDFLRAGLVSGLGFGIGGRGFAAPYLQEAFRPAAAAPAQGVIHIFLQGGLSHLDSFDPKPLAPVEVRGEYGTVASKIDGERFCDRLRRVAAVADRLTVIRSMTHGEAEHQRGTHNMLTGYRPSPAITYPSMGSVVSHELGGRENLPPYVCIPNARENFAGTGYLGSSASPFSVAGEPASRGFRVRDLNPPKEVSADRLARRRRLLSELDERFAAQAGADGVEATEAFYEQAYKLIESESARAAFNIKAEPKKLRDRYGRSRLGQKLILARRLVESGARYVSIFHGGFDHHFDLYRNLNPRLRDLDQAFSALILDLERRQLLDRTLVLITTEFGRTPRFNQTRGRDHWPKVFSVVAAGGGIKRGYVHGASNADGSEPDADPVTPPDLAATVFTQLGIDPTRKLMSPGNRPIDIVREGKVIRELLA